MTIAAVRDVTDRQETMERLALLRDRERIAEERTAATRRAEEARRRMAAVLPEPVMAQAKEALWEYGDTGIGVAEHRFPVRAVDFLESAVGIPCRRDRFLDLLPACAGEGRLLRELLEGIGRLVGGCVSTQGLGEFEEHVPDGLGL